MGERTAIGRRADRMTGRMVEVAAGSVHLREDGPLSGPAIVLLHGYSSSLHAYDALVPLLADDFRVLRVDLLGHGFTRSSAGRFDSASQAAMVGQVLDRVEVDVAAVVGHSFGADVAVTVVEERAGTGAVVVIAQAPDYGVARLPRGSAWLSRPVVGRALRRLATRPTVDRSARFAFAPGVRPGDLLDRPDRLVVDFRASAPAVDRVVLVERPRQVAARGLDARLAELTRPALVILGELDRLYPVAATRARYAELPGVRVDVVSGSGHSPPLEKPRETAERITSFLTA